ncbi:MULTISPECIES: hypothetical protein [Paraburkholderia]|nr:hypothetical protein [Paraburkholderia youngii]
MRKTATASDSPRALRNPAATLQAGLQSVNWAISWPAYLKEKGYEQSDAF